MRRADGAAARADGGRALEVGGVVRWSSMRSAVRAQAHRAPGLYNLRNDYLAYPQHLRRRVHDPDFWALQAAPGERPLVFDVGANVGQSIVSIKAVLPEARIVAFEPIPRAARRAQAIARRYDDVEVRVQACGREGGRDLTLWIPEARGVQLTQLASAEEPDLDAVLRHLQHGGFTWARREDVRMTTVTVPAIALGELGLQPDAMKVDVEGRELEVLLGAESLLQGDGAPAVLIIERGDAPQLRGHLEERSYRLVGCNPVNAVYRRAS